MSGDSDTGDVEGEDAEPQEPDSSVSREPLLPAAGGPRASTHDCSADTRCCMEACRSTLTDDEQSVSEGARHDAQSVSTAAAHADQQRSTAEAHEDNTGCASKLTTGRNDVGVCRPSTFPPRSGSSPAYLLSTDLLFDPCSNAPHSAMCAHRLVLTMFREVAFAAYEDAGRFVFKPPQSSLTFPALRALQQKLERRPTFVLQDPLLLQYKSLSECQFCGGEVRILHAVGDIASSIESVLTGSAKKEDHDIPSALARLEEYKAACEKAIIGPAGIEDIHPEDENQQQLQPHIPLSTPSSITAPARLPQQLQQQQQQLKDEQVSEGAEPSEQYEAAYRVAQSLGFCTATSAPDCEMSEDDLPDIQDALSPVPAQRTRTLSSDGSPFKSPRFGSLSLNFIRKSCEQSQTDTGVVVISKRKSSNNLVPILKLPAVKPSDSGNAVDPSASRSGRLPPLSSKDANAAGSASKASPVVPRLPVPKPQTPDASKHDVQTDANAEEQGDTGTDCANLEVVYTRSNSGRRCSMMSTCPASIPTPRKVPTPRSARGVTPDPYSPKAVACEPTRFDVFTTQSPSVTRTSSLSASREDGSWRDQWFTRNSPRLQASNGSVTGCALRDRMLREQLTSKAESKTSDRPAGSSAQLEDHKTSAQDNSKLEFNKLSACGNDDKDADEPWSTPESKDAYKVGALCTVPGVIHVEAMPCEDQRKGLFSLLTRNNKKNDIRKPSETSALSGALQRIGSAFSQTIKEAREGLVRDTQETDITHTFNDTLSFRSETRRGIMSWRARINS